MALTSSCHSLADDYRSSVQSFVHLRPFVGRMLKEAGFCKDKFIFSPCLWL